MFGHICGSCGLPFQEDDIVRELRKISRVDTASGTVSTDHYSLLEHRVCPIFDDLAR